MISMRLAIPAAVAVALSAPVFAQTFTPSSISGTITAGGAAQQLAGAFAGRRGCTIQNQSAGDLLINDLGTAAATQPSIRVPAGAQYLCGAGGGGASGGALSIFGATTGQAFAGREW